MRPSVANPLEDVSLVYFVRTLPLEPGQCYVLRRYFQPEGNPVVIHVVRRDTVTVPAGTIRRLPPASADHHERESSPRTATPSCGWPTSPRAPIVQLKTHLKFGSINLYLRQIGPDPER